VRAVLRVSAAVEDWAPVFAFFAGTTSAKYNDKQIEQLARQGLERGWCNLCDSPVEGNGDKHVKAHMRDLREWRKRRARDAAKKSAAGLKAHRQEKKLLSDIEPMEEDE
jgi:hypothetical protein